MKKLFAIAMAAMMAVAMFAGCGKGKEDSNVIKIGTSGPLTGDYAVYGKAVEYGLKLAFEEINAKGGLQFEVNAQDDEGDGEKAVNAYNNLMDWGMQIMAGTVTSSACLSVAPECAADQVFMLTPSASDAKVLDAGNNTFQICFSDPNQGIASADYIADHDLAKAVGIIYDSSNPYSVGIYEKFMARAGEVGLNIACEAPFTADSADDLSTQVAKCKEAGCDLLFLPIYTAEAARILTCADTIGYKPLCFGCDGLDGILGVENFDTSLAEGVMLLTPFDATSDDPKTQAFVKNYTEKWGIAPNQFAADAYDVAYAIYEACMECEITPDMPADEVCELLIAWFTTHSFDGITGLDMTWGADGAVSKYPMAVKIENGVYVGAE